jgi:ribosomal protein S18 acetylase RimI-like enzyme
MPHIIIDHNLHNIKTPEFILRLEKAWNLRLLTSDCCDEIESFIELFNDFFQLCEGEKGSCSEILTACPPSKNINKDKFVLGLYDDFTLIGLVDIIRDYPVKKTWTIGYFLIHPKYRGQGTGSKFIKDLEKALSPAKLRCIVQKQNVRALNFWKSNGFLIKSQKKDMVGKLNSVIYVLEK